MFQSGQFPTGVALTVPCPSANVKVSINDYGELILTVESKEDYKELLVRIEQIKISMRNVIEKELV